MEASKQVSTLLIEKQPSLRASLCRWLFLPWLAFQLLSWHF